MEALQEAKGGCMCEIHFLSNRRDMPFCGPANFLTFKASPQPVLKSRFSKNSTAEIFSLKMMSDSQKFVDRARKVV